MSILPFSSHGGKSRSLRGNHLEPGLTKSARLFACPCGTLRLLVHAPLGHSQVGPSLRWAAAGNGCGGRLLAPLGSRLAGFVAYAPRNDIGRVRNE